MEYVKQKNDALTDMTNVIQPASYKTCSNKEESNVDVSACRETIEKLKNVSQYYTHKVNSITFFFSLSYW